MELHPEISIVTACYNAEKFIKRCARSILSQTFSDFEWIVVDDGSTDRSLELLNALSSEDKRIIIISKNNGGVSSARNEGLRHATGKWVCFLDIDDMMPHDAIETMISIADESTDVVFAGYQSIRNQNSSSIPPEYSVVMSSQQLSLMLFKPIDFPYMGYPWAKLFRRSIITEHGLWFDENIWYNEDRLFVLEYILHCSRGIYTTKTVYKYIVNGQGAMATIKGPNYWKFETDLDAFLKMCRIARSSAYVQLQDAVMRGTYASYKWNRRLNKEYGGDNPECNRRLCLKLLSEVSRRRVISYRLTDTVNSLKSRIYTMLHGKNN